jgi:CheY-like chemotaxis protein
VSSAPLSARTPVTVSQALPQSVPGNARFGLYACGVRIPTTSVGRSLLDGMLRADGEVLVLHVGEKPYVRRATRDIEIGTRELPAHVVYALFEEFFPPDAKATLLQTGRADCVLPHVSAEQFSASAVQKEVLSLEIRRCRSDAWHGSTRGAEHTAPLVLLIDDSEDQLDLYGLVLQDRYRLLNAGNGKQGLQLALAERPDVIVCDLGMPGLDGWEVCRRLAANPATASIPVIILTATRDADFEEKAATVGAMCLLTKPCGFALLRDRIDAALERPPLT